MDFLRYVAVLFIILMEDWNMERSSEEKAMLDFYAIVWSHGVVNIWFKN